MNEDVTSWNIVRTHRIGKPPDGSGTAWMEVPGGRLYQHWIAHHTGCSVSTSFVPTPKAPEQIQVEQIDLLGTEVNRLNERLNEEVVAHKARIAQLEQQLKKQYDRLSSCRCG